ncbi:hypothetical protein B9G55_06205 [Saccharibacillus sp. O16]|nr:hypothetical protein B9G55_06205 [Saccharibacillus sp. O16]
MAGRCARCWHILSGTSSCRVKIWTSCANCWTSERTEGMNHFLHLTGELLAPVFKEVLWLSLMGSMLALLILAVRRLLGRGLRPGWLYLLWLPLLLRLLIPWSPESPISLYSWVPQGWVSGWNGADAGAALQQAALTEALDKADDSAATGSEQLPSANQAPMVGQKSAAWNADLPVPSSERSELAADSSAERPAAAGTSGWWTAAALLWLAGALALLASGAAASAAFGRRIRQESGRSMPEETAPAAALLERSRRELGLRRSPRLVVTDQVSVPTVFGAVRPKLLLPRTLLGSLTEPQLHHVLLHELAHIKRRDIAVNLLCFLLAAAHWFNPLFAFSFRKLREDQETACDELALSRMPEGEHREYGLTLLALLERNSLPVKLPLASGLWSAKGEVGRRIARIVGYRRRSIKSALAGATAAVLLAGCALTGPASQPKDGSDSAVAQTAQSPQSPQAQSEPATEPSSESGGRPAAGKAASVKVDPPAAGKEGYHISGFEGGILYVDKYNDPAHPGFSQFTIRKKEGKAVSYLWHYEPSGGKKSVFTSLSDVTGDKREEIVIQVPTGSGTELSLQEIHVLDFDTLEEIPIEDPIARLEQTVKSSIVKRDGNAIMNAELNGMHLTKRYLNADNAGFIFDRAAFGAIVYYTLNEGKLTAELVARASVTEFPFHVVVTYDRNLSVSGMTMYPSQELSYTEGETLIAVGERLGLDVSSGTDDWTIEEEDNIYRVDIPNPNSSGKQGKGAVYGVNRVTGTIFDLTSGSPISSLDRELSKETNFKDFRSSNGSVYQAALSERIHALGADAGWTLSAGDSGFEGFERDGDVLWTATVDGRETTLKIDVFTGLWSIAKSDTK